MLELESKLTCDTDQLLHSLLSTNFINLHSKTFFEKHSPLSTFYIASLSTMPSLVDSGLMTTTPRAINGLSIALRGPYGQPLQTYTNPFAKSLEGFNAALSSSIIRSVPGRPYEVLVEFTEDFKLGDARGVCITVATGFADLDPSNMNDTQSFWIDEKSLRKKHAFSKEMRWGRGYSKAVATPLSMPRPDCKYDLAPMLSNL